MTDSPPPSGRSKTAKSLAFALFRPVLFAVGVIGLALGGLVLSHRSNPEIAALPPPPKRPLPRPPRRRRVLRRSCWPSPSPCRRSRPPTSRAVGGSQRLLDEAAPEPNSEPEPPASDRYELTLRLEKGDTIEKMLADIDVPEADRKQIAREAHGASQEEEAGGRRRDRARCCRTCPSSRRAARAVAVGAAATRARVHHHAPRRRHV